MLNIGNKTFMNLQEAVGWLLENNALPFQSTANYVANTEIAMSTLVNPSPAKVRVGSLIFFADSIVSTVVGVTSNSFIVSDQYNSLVDDITYVSNVAINASGHLICTLSNWDTIDAGLIKQVTGFSINASQHLIASYNDGSSTDLGAIFTGNVNISGTLNATSITGDSIIESMSGYSAQLATDADLTIENVYTSAVKNGNKLTIVSALNLTKLATLSGSKTIVSFTVPTSVYNKLYPTTIGGYNALNFIKAQAVYGTNTFVDLYVIIQRTLTGLSIVLQGATVDSLPLNTPAYLRIEQTFLLANGLI